MTLFYKQLILLSLLIVVILSGSGYFVYKGLNEIVASFAEDSAVLTARDFKNTFTSVNEKLDNRENWNSIQNKSLRQELLHFTQYYEQVQDFFVVNKDTQIVFSLKPENTAVSFWEKTGNPANHTDLQLAKSKNSNKFQVSWKLEEGSLTAVLTINPEIIIRDEKHKLYVRFYLIGFAGILGIFLIAVTSQRLLHLPMRTVEKAMVHIDKRRYGFRIKRKAEDEFGDVYDKINTALVRLEQLDSVQRTAVKRKNALLKQLKGFYQYLDEMAHEVKNPLHALVINIDVLKTKIEKERPKDDTLKHVDIIEREIEHTKEVIDGFLQYMRPGVPKKERVPINTVIKDVCQMAAAEADKRKIKIESRLARSLTNVLVDVGQLQQALLNLIINAIHASHEEGKILVRSWEKGKKILLSINDTGVGISKDELKKIFDLYYTTKKDGSGIGLPVTKRIIEANGGQIQFESKVGKGTTVTLHFNAA